MLNNSLENIYDFYSRMLFNIAVEISATEQEAEEILLATFKKIHEQNIVQQIPPSLCLKLIKLLIQTAHERLKPEELKHNFKLKQFESTPLLHKLLCEQINLERHCIENNISLAEAGKILREEFNLLRNAKKRELKIPEFSMEMTK